MVPERASLKKLAEDPNLVAQKGLNLKFKALRALNVRP